MALNGYLNPDGMKAARLADRISKASVFDFKLKSILEKRYGVLDERANRTERLVAVHEKQLQRCQQEWNGGLALQINLSARGPEMLGGKNAACIMFVPTDDTSEKSLKWLMKTHHENKSRQNEINKRLALRVLAKNDRVMKYFSDLKTDGNFARLYELYRSANLLVGQNASPDQISGFIERRMRAIALKPDCDCKGCLLTSMLRSDLSAIFLFDIDHESGRILPRVYGTESQHVSPDRLLSDVVLDAREVEVLMHALVAISLDERKEQTSEKSMFNKIMETMGLHKTAEGPKPHDGKTQ